MAIQYKGNAYTGSDIDQMRKWIYRWLWPEVPEKNIKEMSDIEVIEWVDRNLEGGVENFKLLKQS